MSYVGRVAAGAIAEKYLHMAYGVEIVAFVSSVSKVKMPFLESDDEDLFSDDFMQLLNTITRDIVDQHIVRCPDNDVAEKMREV